MRQASLDDLSVFIEVARANGFRAAAQNLKLGPSSVSEAVTRIENRIGVRLIERTTRKMSLTEAGEDLLQSARPALTELRKTIAELGDTQNSLSGTLRLSAPRSSSPFFLDDVIAQYCAQYPEVNMEILYDDRKVDLVTSGIDAAIRSQTLLENETVAVEIGPSLDMALIGAPSYFAKHDMPAALTDLTEHAGIRFSFGSADRLAPWTFTGDGKLPFMVSPQPCMIVNDLVSMASFAKAGVGLAYIYRRIVEDEIASGELISIFDAYIPPLPRYTVNYLTKRHMPARLRAFIDLAKAHK